MKKIRETIYDFAENWNKTSDKKVPYEFVNYLIVQLEKDLPLVIFNERKDKWNLNTS